MGVKYFMSLDSISPKGINPNKHLSNSRDLVRDPIEIPASDSVVKALQDENTKFKREIIELKKRIAQNSNQLTDNIFIEIDANKGNVRLRNIKTRDWLIDNLEMKVSGAPENIKNTLSIQSLMNKSGNIQNPDLSWVKNSHVQIEKMKVRLPESAATSVINKVADFEKDGIRDVRIHFSKDKITMEGTARKVISIPFSMEASLGLGEKNNLFLNVQDIKALGFIPLPNILQRLVIALSDSPIKGAGFSRDGSRFKFELNQILPENLKLKLNSVKVEDGYITLES